jgi:glycosyltransferase involved in cell wall biosynthesis
MHVLFVHQNYPAQFGHVARYLIATHGFRCTFVSRLPPGVDDGVERIQYVPRGGAGPQTHTCSQPVENAVWHSHAVYETLKARPDIRPDLVVGHSGFLTTSFLMELYPCPVVNYFEYYFHTTGPDLDFRPDIPYPDINRLRSHVRNSFGLLDLECCDLGYSPTRWQRDRIPETYRSKVRVIFDGIDPAVWRPRPGLPRQVGGRTIPDGTKLVTYVSRGLESLRGFDVFMKAANVVCRRRTDVVFVVVGGEQVYYSGDMAVTAGKSFKEWVLAQDSYDLPRFYFTGTIPAAQLADLFALTDLHVYLTVPFVLSWSLMNALACGATVLASDTAPVREVIRHGENGLLTDFYDVNALADRMCEVLDRPHDYRHLGRNGAEMIRSRYSVDVCLPQMLRLYHDAAARTAGSQAGGAADG